MTESEFLTFNVGKEVFGISVDYVREIIKADTHVNLVPNAKPHVLGVFQPRDELLTGIDMNYALFGKTSEYSAILHKAEFTADDKHLLEAVNFIICNNNGRWYAWLVNNVREINNISTDQIFEVPEVVGNSHKYLKGIFKINNDLVQILDLDSLLAILDAE